MTRPPLSSAALIDLYFLEHRAKLIDLAAFLDRIDRAGSDSLASESDPRLNALRSALALLSDGQPERTRRILEHFSDPTTDPIPAAPMKGAIGVHAPLGIAEPRSISPSAVKTFPPPVR